jgi:hypothetical protein
MNACAGVKGYLHDSKWLGRPGPAGALQRCRAHRAPAGREARRRHKLFYPSCTGRSWSSVAGSLSWICHKAMCTCVSSCWEVAKAGRGGGSPAHDARRTTHVASSANRLRPGWKRLADGHMTFFHSSFTLAENQDKHGPWNSRGPSPHSARCSGSPAEDPRLHLHCIPSIRVVCARARARVCVCVCLSLSL